jgi:superfamily II RNA helicase
MEADETQPRDRIKREYKTRRSDVLSGLTVAGLIPIVMFVWNLRNDLQDIVELERNKNTENIKITKEFLDQRINQSNDDIKDEIRELRTDMRELRATILRIYGGKR